MLKKGIIIGVIASISDPNLNGGDTSVITHTRYGVKFEDGAQGSFRVKLPNTYAVGDEVVCEFHKKGEARSDGTGAYANDCYTIVREQVVRFNDKIALEKNNIALQTLKVANARLVKEEKELGV